jgi:predicted dehydrogenase
MWTRFLPHVAGIHQAIAAGEIGEVRTVLGDYGHAFTYDPEHRLYNAHLAGGALLDVGVYPVSFAHDVLGSPERVEAVGALTDTGVDGQSVVALDFGDGRFASVQSSLWVQTPQTVRVGGTEGYIAADPWTFGGGGFTVVRGDGTERRYDGFRGEGKQYQAAEVARCLDAGLLESERMPWQATLDVMRTLDEVRRQVGVVYPGE